MSYCVHCGVKLSAGANACPLCGTPVYDPLHKETVSEHLWPEREDHFEIRRLNWPYISRLVLLGLALIAGVAILCDFATTGHVGWSWYAVGAALFLAGFAAVPSFYRIVAKSVCAYLGLEFLLLIIAWRNDGFRWYSFLALPFSTITTAYVLICIYLTQKKKLRILHRTAVCLACLVLSLIAVEILTDLYSQNEIRLFWSVYAIIPLSVLAVLLLLLSRNRRLIERIRKNTFISPV